MTENFKEFKDLIEDMKLHGLTVPKQKTSISIEAPHVILRNAFDYFLSLEGVKTVWIEEYDQVGDWMVNNQGRGLFLSGDCGLGKSLLGRYIIPAILLKYCRKVVNVYGVQEMNEQVDKIMTEQFISLDDIGTEEISNTFGNKRLAFAEIMDAVEKNSRIAIITSNLDKKALLDKYGFRVYDRIMATTVRVKFKGETLRK